MSTRLYKKLPTQLWQLSTSFLPIPFLISHVPRVSRFFNKDIVWNAKTSAALLWKEMPGNCFLDHDYCIWEDLPDDNAVTLLSLACACEAPVHHVCILLQAAPNSIHILDRREKWTPIWYAVVYHNTDVVDLLLNSNADPGLRYDGETLLGRACDNHCYDTTDILLRAYDANVNDTHNGSTALQVVCDDRRHDIVRLLLRHGATPTTLTTAICTECRCRYCDDVNCDSAMSE